VVPGLDLPESVFELRYYKEERPEQCQARGDGRIGQGTVAARGLLNGTTGDVGHHGVHYQRCLDGFERRPEAIATAVYVPPMAEGRSSEWSTLNGRR